MKKFNVQKKEVEGKTFYYLDVGSADHNRTCFRLWISPRLVQRDETGEFISFPVIGGKVEKTPRGNLVLRPSPGFWVAYFLVECGYRGGSDFEVLSPQLGEGDIFPFVEYESPLGRLGISRGGLINVPYPTSLKIKWVRTGRLYGSPPEGVRIISPDGEEVDLDFLPDGLEALEELQNL
ncbi:MAG: hypothetical protein QXT77_09725 [Candidatus Methanomethylicaceae archaeon]